MPTHATFAELTHQHQTELIDALVERACLTVLELPCHLASHGTRLLVVTRDAQQLLQVLSDALEVLVEPVKVGPSVVAKSSFP
jgi:hypothetical protein